MAAAAPKTLSASSVPGSLSAKDREVVADGFNALRNNPQPSPASGLRIVDLLDSRFIFTVTHPRPLNAAAFRALALKLKTVRKVTLDLPRNAVRVECWRATQQPDHGGGGGKRSGKRKRGAAPSYSCRRARPRSKPTQPPTTAPRFARSCSGFSTARRSFVFSTCTYGDETQNTYTLAMGQFDAVADTFVLDLCAQWRTGTDVQID